MDRRKKKGIGGSDAAGIVGLNAYTTLTAFGWTRRAVYRPKRITKL